MATNPATVADLEARALRPLSQTELDAAPTMLEDAWNIILATRPSVAARLDAIPVDEAFEALVVQVECAMVLRVLSNPDGKLEEEIDDYRYRLDAARSSGSLYLSAAELELLGLGDAESDVAFSIRPAGRTPGYPGFPW